MAMSRPAALRSPDEVMRLDRLGAAHPTRLSFLRALLRRVEAEGWTYSRTAWEIDPEGFEYTVEAHARVEGVVIVADYDLAKQSDIERVAKRLRMKLANFESEYLQVDEDGDKIFQCMPCPFLGADNLCDVYDVRPKACREFPHTDRKKFLQINHLTLKNTLICPATYLFVEKLRERVG